MLRLSRRLSADDAVGASNVEARSETVQAGRAAALLTFVGLVTGVSNLAFNVVVARLTGVTAYGTFVALLTLATIAGVLAVATNYTVARRVARADVLSGALIRHSLASSWPWLLLGLGLFAISPFLQRYLHLQSPLAVLTAVGVYVVIVAAAAPAGILIGLRRFRTIAGLNLAGALVRLAVAPLLARGPNGTAGALAASAIQALLIGCCSLLVVLMTRRRPSDWQTARAGAHDAGRLSFETMSAALLAAMLWSLWSLPPLLARHSLDPVSAGNFAAAQLLAGGILFLSAPAITAFLPVTARGRTLRTALLGLAGLTLLCASGIAFLAVLGPSLMRLLYGGGYAAPAVLFAALAGSATLVAAVNFSAWMAQAMRRLVWVAFAGATVAVAAEVVVGVLLRPAPLALALLPGTAIVLALAVVTVILPEPAYSQAATFIRAAVIDRTQVLRRRGGRGIPPPGWLAEPPSAAVERSASSNRDAAVRGLARAATTGRRLTARRFAVALAVVGLISLGLAGEDSPATVALALVTLTALVTATALALVTSLRVAGRPGVGSKQRRAWLPSYLLVASIAAAASQSWFRPGTSIAGTDLAPPDGTAWLARLFAPWTWTGSDIGASAANQRQLPWAAVLQAVHALGGSEVLAQRLWLTLLYVGVGVAAVVFLRTLGLRPIAAVVGGLVYLFNPQTLLSVPSDVYLAALVLLPAIAAVILAAARGSLRLRTAAGVLVLSVPLLGYVSQQPSLLFLLAVTMIVAALLAGWLWGADVFWRGLRAVGIGGAVILAASAYWAVPTIIRTSGASTEQFSSLASWAWTETRATLANGLWLNTSWSWKYPEYFPYSSAYSQQPLLLLKYFLPALAFAALLVPAAIARRRKRTASHLRAAVAASAIALFIVFLCTGTNLPGALIFDPLYSLPLGFLLREPDAHFLGAVALAYAVLIAIGVDYAAGRILARLVGRHRRLPVLPVARIAAVVAVVGVAALGSNYPLLTGAVVPDSRPTLPSRHVSFPIYWHEMADFVNAMPATGDVLVLPADRFYQVDYSWGYYGIDSFIPDLISRRVILPLPQGYISASPQLLDVVNQIDNDISAKRWTAMTRLAGALGTPFILVRRDVNPAFLGKTSIPDPATLAASLASAPGVNSVHRSGPLELFRVAGVTASGTQPTRAYATVNSDQPDLDVLAQLPHGLRLVSSTPRPGVTTVTQVRPITEWIDEGGSLSTTVREATGWIYRVFWLHSPVGPPHGVSVTSQAGSVTLTIPLAETLVNGDFATGVWGEVGDCNAVNGREAAQLSAAVDQHGGPDGHPALRLGAQLDSACEQTNLAWKGGSLLLDMSVRRVSGSAPRICVFELGLNRCARTDPVPNSAEWTHYRTAVTPDRGTKGLILALYADGSAAEGPTLDLYADVRARELPLAVPSVDVIGTPTTLVTAPPVLVVQPESYDGGWSGAPSWTHVRVDGLINGWLTNRSGQLADIAYRPAVLVELANALSAVVGIAVLAFMIPKIVWISVGRIARRTLGRSAVSNWVQSRRG